VTALVVLPLWHVLLGVLGVAFGSAYLGAKTAISMCARQNGCAMRVKKEKGSITQNLEEQLRALHAKHPELKAMRKSSDAALEATGEHPVIPEDKP